MGRHKLYIPCAFVVGMALVMLAVPSNAADSDICAAVLSNKAFNTYNTTFQSSISDQTARLICTLHISNRQELRNQSASLGIGGQYGAISGFLDAAESSGSRSVEETYDKMCNKNDTSFIKNVFLSQQMQITSENVRSWERCVEITSSSGLFSALHVSTDNKLFTITVNYKKPQINPQKLVLQDIDKRYGLTCLVIGKSMAGFAPEENGLSGNFSITCERPDPNTNNTIAINTSVGDIGPFEVPSKAYSELTLEVQQGAAQVAGLTAALAEMRNKRPQVFVQPAPRATRCDTPWPESISTVECPTDSVRISGGCSFTCKGLDHTISVPTANGWQCGAIATYEGNKTEGPSGGPRTFQPVVLCLRP
jgi:hypothetical protein